MIYSHHDLIDLLSATYARGLLAYLEPEAVAEGIVPPPDLTKDERVALRANLPELWSILKGLEFYERRTRIERHYKLKVAMGREIKTNDAVSGLLPIFEQKHGHTTFETLEALADYMHWMGNPEQLIAWGRDTAPETFKRLNDEREAYYASIKTATLKLASAGNSKASEGAQDYSQRCINTALTGAALPSSRLIADLSESANKDPALVDLLDDLSPGWEIE